ncbi:MAG: restriction endonuclease [Thermosipho sp. (in: Bacteria)]|nr:restriction endonuclease [Thermosipho sp. (in: thermotogales)]
MPKQREIEIPLLQVLFEIGGSGKPSEIYPLVTQKFPQLTQEDLQATLASGGNKWTNRIQWVRQKLITEGYMYSPQHGVWAITQKGIERLQGKLEKESINEPKNLVELYEEYEQGIRSQLLERLLELSPSQFEAFSKKLLRAYGFVSLENTKISNDGGIDGYGKLKVGIATMNVAFQCKRWQENVGRNEIDKFRGAIQGEFEQGIFFTTSDFTEQAKNASIKKGAVPIILLNGEAIIDIMIEKGLGVEKRPLYLFFERVQDFSDDD